MDYLKHLHKAVERRRDLFTLPGTTAFRLVNGEGDGIDGLTVDIYGEYLLVQYFIASLIPEMSRIRMALERAVVSLPVSIKGILLKNRCRGNGDVRDRSSDHKSVLISGSMPPKVLIVEQNGSRVTVDLVEGQNTGLFLDMREVRGKLEGYYHNIDSLLNLFCYTAVFSVHARMNGVMSAVNVDLSKAVLRRARTNYRINNIAVDDRDFICDDAMKWVTRSVKRERHYSLVIFDPPTFSRNKKRTFSVQKNYADFCDRLSCLASGRYVLTTINAVSVSESEYRSFHPENWSMEFFCHEPGDFPFRHHPYLKAGLWRVKPR